MRVLIAEDEPISRLVLQSTLRKWGHEPVVSCNGAEALAALEGEAPPDIAILDWMMPEMDGPEVCRKIRETRPALPVYIILLTARTQREDLVTGLTAGADDYVTKPFNSQELLARFQVGVRITELQRNLGERVRDLEVALTRLGRLQQAQKLDALGHLASGVAHEINTPTQYIGDNIRYLQECWEEIDPLLRASAGKDIEMLLQEIPKAIRDSLQGVQKVARIVQAMRDFSYTASDSKVSVDINQAMQTTLTVSTNEWRYTAQLVTDFDPDLPPVTCLGREIRQVFLSLIVNAAQAIAEAFAETATMGTLQISTCLCGDSVEIRVRDTGMGIRDEHRSRIFEPFFTTKDVGKGTGQSLAMAYSVVVQQHNGRIWFDSEFGKGTTFFIRLPIDGTGKENDFE